MSRTVQWADWKERGVGAVRDSARLSERLAQSRRAGSARVRAPEDVEIITRMMRIEIGRRLTEGRLVKLGPREYELHPRVR